MKSSVNYKKSKHFNALIEKYISKEQKTASLYNLYPSINNIKKQAKAKLSDYKNRNILVSVLKEQYSSLELSSSQLNNLNLLEKSNTVTITAGHQLNLMAGPLYIVYKIIQTIKLCNELNTNQQAINYIPIFWMATEDHDWAEINNFTYNNLKYEWAEIPKQGATGEFSTKELKFFIDNFIDNLEEKKYKNKLIELIKLSYLNKETDSLAESNRRLFHEFFKEFGLLVIDANNFKLKKLFIPYFKNEIQNQSLFKEVSKTNNLLIKKEVQVNPREINLFYLDKNLRERIIKTGNLYKVNHTELVFSEEEILQLIETNPEKFSPNVLLRPLYQEVILPNVAYIGGGSEISYWLQLKLFFDNQKILFPVIIPRCSILLLEEKQLKKLNSLKILPEELFLPIETLINVKIKEKSSLEIPFLELKKVISKLYLSLSKKATKTEKTFLNLVVAQKIRQLKAIDSLEKRLLKAEKIKYTEYSKKITELKSNLFPNNSLQERTQNLTDFYLDYENDLFKKIYTSIKPINFNFTLIAL